MEPIGVLTRAFRRYASSSRTST